MIDILLSYKSVWRILLLYSYAPGKGLYRDEIKKMSKLANMPLDMALNRLIQFGILIKGGRVYKIDNSNKYTEKIFDIINNIKKDLRGLSYNTILILHEFVRSTLDIPFYIKEMMLFGSRAKLIPAQDSDFDICIITREKDMKKETELENTCEKIEKNFDVNFQLHFFTENEWSEGRKKKDPLIEEIIKDGVRLL